MTNGFFAFIRSFEEGKIFAQNSSSLSVSEPIPSSVICPATDTSASSPRVFYLSLRDNGLHPKDEDLNIDDAGVTGGTVHELHE